ncbi:hypothetical protein M2145_002504, partial [Lachnospiraceae bacterium PF1-21]|uniref:GBS Bsp-like repeat-containing protein n=1 Tax=Ohessyouella blattaphilus TaxID=2949333 RepID=UPI003E29B127
LSGVSIANHEYAIGNYNVHAYVYAKNGTEKGYGVIQKVEESTIMPSAEIETSQYNASLGTFTITVKNVKSIWGVKKIRIPVWCFADQSDIVWYETIKNANSTYSVTVNVEKHKYHIGTYIGHVYLTENSGRECVVGVSSASVSSVPLNPIMGKSNVSIAQMVDFFGRGNNAFDVFSNYGTQYDGIYKKNGVNSIEEFCQIYIEEANAEGVRADVAFVQAMIETGYLKYGGQVKPDQFNFAGIGATDDGAAGNSLNDVRAGIRAQIQHLKCYASTLPLNNSNIDPRWDLVTRGVAPYVELLTGRWATDSKYHIKINSGLSILHSL